MSSSFSMLDVGSKVLYHKCVFPAQVSDAVNMCRLMVLWKCSRYIYCRMAVIYHGSMHINRGYCGLEAFDEEEMSLEYLGASFSAATFASQS